MKSEDTPLEQIERSLAALEAYSEMWVLDLQESTLDELKLEDFMFHKNSDGTQPWFEMLQIRSTLLLARAIERQNARPRIINYTEGE